VFVEEPLSDPGVLVEKREGPGQSLRRRFVAGEQHGHGLIDDPSLIIPALSLCPEQ
jgi:hypothetical protein